MKSFIATALLLLRGDATQEEMSLMQSLVARRQMNTESAPSRKDNTARLMETATKMIKNGATPDVITFIETTITEVNSEVLGVIVDEHHIDQQTINDLLDQFDRAIAAMQSCAESVRQQHTDRTAASHAHQVCRSDESIYCGESRKCEEELETLWVDVKREETTMRAIHELIYGRWCSELNPPPHPGLADPFEWVPEVSKEGPETSQTVGDYPVVDYTGEVIAFREFSVLYFSQYIAQKIRVEESWRAYNTKLIECAETEERWTIQVEECDGLQTVFHDQACEHHSSNRQCAQTFGHEYHLTMIAYQNAVVDIRQKEYDRKREWETLHIVTCLLETVYTHVIHSIDSGDPCPTTESHPEQTAAEINTCHIVEEHFTENLTIVYGTPPEPPVLPPVVAPPCSQQYLWEESGSFARDIQAHHTQKIQDVGLDWGFHTVVSAFGWPGCAAPKACTPCDAEELIYDETLTERCAFTDDSHGIDQDGIDCTCRHHQQHLFEGQMDQDTFRCASGDQCIPSRARCNGHEQCYDGSDEVGCITPWGEPAVQGAEICREPFSSDVQFRCGSDYTNELNCIDIAGRCNGVPNCADGSDEEGCPHTTEGLTVEAMTGYTSSIETTAMNSAVFYNRTYTFGSLGSFTGQRFIKMSNDDKHIRGSHVQMKLRLPRPTTVYVVKLADTELPWVHSQGYTLATNLEGVSYSGFHGTRHKDWADVFHEESYETAEVYQKTFPAGTVEMRGNNGGDGSYLIFVADPEHEVLPA